MNSNGIGTLEGLRWISVLGVRCEQNGKDPDEILDRLYESRSRERPRDQDGNLSAP